MNLKIIVTNNETKIYELYKIMDECELFHQELFGNPIVVNELYFNKLPKINEQRRYIVIGDNLQSTKSNVLTFNSKEQFRNKLSLINEIVYMICDNDMYEFFKEYSKNIYVVNFKKYNDFKVDDSNKTNKIIFENNFFKMIKYSEV